MHTKSVLAAVAMLVMTGGYSAYAASNQDSAETAAVSTVTVSAAEAIAAVEARGTGKVVEIALADDGNAAVYKVTTLLPDGTETNYAVDAKTGEVTLTADAGQSGEHGSANNDNHESDNGAGSDGDGESNDDGENGENGED